MDEGTAKLYAKYWGGKDLAHSDEFWEDVFEYYSQDYRDAPLPLEYNPSTVRMVLDMLDCPPGVCGECCRYNRIRVKPNDIQRIIDNTEYTQEELDKLVIVDGNKMFLKGQPDGCPFLVDNACLIHPFRPDGCYLFPIQSSKEVISDGNEIKQMQIRIKCRPALYIARRMITKVIDKGGKLLLPDLTIIPYSEG